MKFIKWELPCFFVAMRSMLQGSGAYLAVFCKRSGADPRGLWDAANKRQTNPEDTPRPRPSMMAPILAHIGSPPFWATTVASIFCRNDSVFLAIDTITIRMQI